VCDDTTTSYTTRKCLIVPLTKNPDGFYPYSFNDNGPLTWTPKWEKLPEEHSRIFPMYRVKWKILFVLGAFNVALPYRFLDSQNCSVSTLFLASPLRPDRLWVPPNFSRNGYQVLFPQGVKQLEREAGHSLYAVPRLIMIIVLPLLLTQNTSYEVGNFILLRNC
jgi:hypothetical protein